MLKIIHIGQCFMELFKK